eukprot:TRINITY_DN5006_c0_g1_i2.p1 TRINITY_DN5006_c0_g1~~TRINITY_DN5006_c0_g1_i2.p1  ORF type:complete len:240 (+),score=23.81 TRINITY_DN5006_c0_g1_i2:363-1082(+)
MLARVLKCSPDEPRYTRSLRRHLNRTPLCFDNLKSGEKSYVELDPKDLRIDERFFLPIAEKAKAMMMARVSGTFFTSNGAIKTGNLCHESTMPYILHKNWPDHPIIALRKDEVHYNNIKEDNNSTLIIYPHLPKHIQPTHVPLPKVSLLGPLRSIHAKTDKNLIMTIYNKAGQELGIFLHSSSILCPDSISNRIMTNSNFLSYAFLMLYWSRHPVLLTRLLPKSLGRVLKIRLPCIQSL